MNLLRRVLTDPLVRKLREHEERLRDLERADVPADLVERVKQLEEA